MSLLESQRNIIKLALFVCATDGLISDTEEETIIKLFVKEFPSVTNDELDREIEEFYTSNKQLEFYAERIKTKCDKTVAVHISLEAAASDGLDVRENIALKRVLNLWNMDLDEVNHGE
ncbi:hypothetical protein ACQ5ES_11210 [Pseudidiomarina sp. E22-M8]|uniref:hypothetical protein n=1 Tax=Pseudidiomarina sp. E22-M8 TaxID=3424768 RepID=UPI00403D4B97